MAESVFGENVDYSEVVSETIDAECYFAECYFAECRYAECCSASDITTQPKQVRLAVPMSSLSILCV